MNSTISKITSSATSTVSMCSRWNLFRNDWKVPFLYNVSVGEMMLAHVNDTLNNKIQVEHRGLHQTDKRVTELTGIQFIKGMPQCSLLTLLDKKVKISKALQMRSAKCKNKILFTDYFRSLIVRNIRGQILNPALRYDWTFIRFGERFRKNALTNRFANFALSKPGMEQTIHNYLIHG